MNKSVLTVIRLVFFSLMLLGLVAVMILNIVEAGVRTTTDKIFLVLFILLIIWAAARIIVLVRSLRNS